MISNDGSNNTLDFKRDATQLMPIDQNGNMNIPMINSCTWLGNTIDVSNGGTGITRTTPNGIICAGSTSSSNLCAASSSSL